MIWFFRKGISFFLQLLALYLLGTAALALAVMFFPEMESHLDFEPNHEMIPKVAAFSALAGLFVGWLSLVIVRKKKKKPQAPGSAKARDQWEPPSFDELAKARDEINERFDRAQGPEAVGFSYETTEQFLFEGQYGGWRKVRFTLSALIERTLETMTVQEREVLRIIAMLAAIGVPGMESKIRMWRAAIVWGEGKARIEEIDYNFNAMWGKSLGLGTYAAIIQWAMKKKNVSFHTVRDEVVDLVSEAWEGADKDHPILSDIMRRLRGGQAWASPNDYAPDLTRESKPTSILIGGTPDQEGAVFYQGDGAVLSIAPPGAGKTQTQVIPNLLHWKGPAIVLDVKGELYDTTAVWRALNVGPVHRFAPYDPDNSASYNPLARVRGDNDNIWEDSRFLASMMLVPTKSSDPFWQDSAEELIAAAIAATCYERDPEDRSMADVLDIVYRNGWDEFIATLCSADNRPMVRYGTQLLETDADNKALQSILKVAQTTLRAWSGPKIERVLSGIDWRPEDLRSGSPTIYICVEAGQIDAFASVLRVIIGQHIRALTSSLPPEGAQPILFMLDEFPRLKHMAPLEEALEIGRQYGIRLFMIGQSVGQIEQHYQNAKGLMGACGVRVYMNPSLTDGTAQRISNELGEFESPLDGQKKPVASPTDLAGPKYRDKQIVLRRSGKPVCLDKRMAFTDPELQARMSMAKPQRTPEPPQPEEEDAKPDEKPEGDGFAGYGTTYKF